MIEDFDRVGTVFLDRYRVEKLVARGGMGHVYKAIDILIKREIALKIIHHFPSEHLNNIFLELEARILGLLTHPNIVNVFEVGTTENTIYIAMEWLDGHTLAQEIESSGRLSLERTTFILQQVIDAIAFAHSNNIIHGNLKPHKIMISSGVTGALRLKVLDFGVGQIFTGTGEDTFSIEIGTLYYASPEQGKKGAKIDFRSDIYSLGISLYEMLTGKLPFQGMSVHEILNNKVANKPLSLCSLRPEIPLEINDLVLKMIEVNPNSRPPKIKDIYPIFERAIRPPVTKKRDPYHLVGNILLNKYRLTEFTAVGGIGAVYQAQEIDSGEKIAIKVLKPDQATPDSIQRFVKEAQIASQLSHPHIVKVTNSGIDEDITFLVMEWLIGNNLENEIEKKGRIPLDRVLTILPQICDSLDYAHARNVIHLDVKPSNIFLIGDMDNNDFIKMIDYGLAKVLDTKSSLTVTRFGGTYAYCAPEQFSGKISRRSDIYSLGVTLYHMLTGVLPFGGSYLNAKIHNLDFPPVPSMRKMQPDIPIAVEQVILKALSKDPKDRHQSIDEFLKDFLEASEQTEICQQHITNLASNEDTLIESLGSRKSVLNSATYSKIDWRDISTWMKFVIGLIVIITLMSFVLYFWKSSPNIPVSTPLSARFAPAEITADTSKLSENDRKALDKIIEAAKLMDDIFLRQVWSGNVDMKKKLAADTTPEGQEHLHYFNINVGPWSRIDNNEVFIDGAPKTKPPQANFYPDDITREEFKAWIKGLPEPEKAKATGFYYTIRRGNDKKLKIVPYSEEYKEFLEPAAKLLKEAAELTSNPTLKNFLNKRAEAFASNDYYASDIAWMDLDAPIDVTIGPYETYEDELFGYKAAYESFVTLRDDAGSEMLVKFASYLQELENNLPIDGRYRNPKLGTLSPIRVVDAVFTSGDGNRGVQIAAFNLPNDERVINEKGLKKVLLKNHQEAKFNHVLIPISKIAIDPAQQGDISFDAFFTHILAHELLHGIGPHNIKLNGADSTVRLALKENHAAMEEAKADITGLWALQYLMDKGTLDKKMERAMYVTYLASTIRSIRFGITEAHGKGQAMQFNYLLDEGAFKVDEAKGTFSVDFNKVKSAVRKLTNEIMTIQAEGSYEEAKALLDKYGVIRPTMQKTLDKLGDVPFDIFPHYKLADSLLAQAFKVDLGKGKS